MSDELLNRGNHKFPHMCRMDHEPIGFQTSGDDERCPVCKLLDGLRAIEEFAWNEQVAEIATELFEMVGGKLHE